MIEEIDIIELLQRVKEGKAPKEIEIKGWKYRCSILDESYDYIRVGLDDGIYDLVDDYNIFDILDIKIKILDKPIIEELEDTSNFDLKQLSIRMRTIRENREKINEIIRRLNNEPKTSK